MSHTSRNMQGCEGLDPEAACSSQGQEPKCYLRSGSQPSCAGTATEPEQSRQPGRAPRSTERAGSCAELPGRALSTDFAFKKNGAVKQEGEGVKGMRVQAEGEMEDADKQTSVPSGRIESTCTAQSSSLSLPPQGTHTLGCSKQMPARTHISSSLGRLRRCWIRAQKS